MNSKNRNHVVNLILSAIALLMGIAVVALQVMGSASAATTITLLGIGLFCLALSSMQARSS